MVEIELPGGPAVLRELEDGTMNDRTLSGPDEVVIAEGKNSAVWGLDREDGPRSEVRGDIVISKLDEI